MLSRNRSLRGVVNAEDKASVELLANTLGSERNVVERIRAELAERGWTQAELTRRMEQHARGSSGGVLHPVVLSKLLGGDRGRHVSIDQLVTLAGVFGVSVAEMLLPPGSLEMAAVLRALADGPRLQREAMLADAVVVEAQDVVAQAMLSDPMWLARVADDLEEAVDTTQAQRRPLSDSVRVQFLRGIVERHAELKKGASDGQHQEA